MCVCVCVCAWGGGEGVVGGRSSFLLEFTVKDLHSFFIRTFFIRTSRLGLAKILRTC